MATEQIMQKFTEAMKEKITKTSKKPKRVSKRPKSKTKLPEKNEKQEKEEIDMFIKDILGSSNDENSDSSENPKPVALRTRSSRKPVHSTDPKVKLEVPPKKAQVAKSKTKLKEKKMPDTPDFAHKTKLEVDSLKQFDIDLREEVKSVKEENPSS